MSSSIRPKGGNLKWWQQEIIETTKKQIIPAEEEKPDLRKSKEFVDTLSRLGGLCLYLYIVHVLYKTINTISNNTKF